MHALPTHLASGRPITIPRSTDVRDLPTSVGLKRTVATPVHRVMRRAWPCPNPCTLPYSEGIPSNKEVLMHAFRRVLTIAVPLTLAGVTLAAPGVASADASASAHQVAVSIMKPYRGGSTQAATTAVPMTYHGGTGGIGVETAPRVYLVLWGSQWASDPSGEASILNSLYANVGGSNWNSSVTQYCQGVAIGTATCGASGTHVTNPAGMLTGTWSDKSVAAARHPTQSQLAAEAVKAASHFGNTTAASNASVQYVVATPHGYSSSGFGTQYCAWHSSTSSTYGNIAYSNLPYITDAGASCGANFNRLGANAGITIVAGHELAETETDQFPSSGWIDNAGAENGDKCAWISSGQGAAAIEALGSAVLPMQSLWSNAFNGDAGGCVQSS